MRYAIISDIHSNLAALEEVLSHLSRQGVDALWCLGDLVGYGPEPNECIDRIRQQGALCVAGNHDVGAIEPSALDVFNYDAAEACRWNGAQLRPDNAAFLRELPRRLEKEPFTIVHGSPRDPVWEYVASPYEAEVSFRHFSTAACLVGHVHVPAVAFESLAGSGCEMAELAEGVPIAVGQRRLIFNPGSVGQPRDGDSRASYALYDSGEGTLRLFRVPYDVRVTQEKMQAAGLPRRLVLRLGYGM